MALRHIFYKVYNSVKLTKDKAFSPKYLLYTNVLISIGISTSGDILEQSYEVHQKVIEKFDSERTYQMGVSGGTAGVICHHWYNFLDKVIIGRSLEMVLKKLLLDQCVCSPVIILSFFATVAIFQENPIKNFNDEVSDKFWTLYKAEWVVWPPAQIINFYFLPTKYRVVYDNTISLGYDMYTSRIKHYKEYSPKIEEEEFIENKKA